MREGTKTVLWSSNTVAPNNTTITLSDSIDHYDELIFYGSGTRDYAVNVRTEYPVIPGVLNEGGPFFCGKWGANDTWILCNGTQVWISGTSGYVGRSYFWGKRSGNTTYYGEIVNNRVNDVRPYKIVGVKY